MTPPAQHLRPEEDSHTRVHRLPFTPLQFPLQCSRAQATSSICHVLWRRPSWRHKRFSGPSDPARSAPIGRWLAAPFRRREQACTLGNRRHGCTCTCGWAHAWELLLARPCSCVVPIELDEPRLHSQFSILDAWMKSYFIRYSGITLNVSEGRRDCSV